MLVLTRKQNEKIRIGDSITVTVLRMKGKGVRLGIEAPQDVNVIRGELCFELNEEESEESSTEISPSDAPRGRKPGARTSRETRDHWPRRKQRDQAPAACGTVDSTSPLKAMVDARTV
jgi:carbon storage regulator